MTQEEMQFNQLCHEFLFPNAKEEYESGEISIEDGLFSKAMGIFGDFNLMKYHLDWNWIHEVIEAIEKLGHTVDVWNNVCVIPHLKKTIGETKKEAVIQAINQFLIWYNENNK